MLSISKWWDLKAEAWFTAINNEERVFKSITLNIISVQDMDPFQGCTPNSTTNETSGQIIAIGTTSTNPNNLVYVKGKGILSRIK